MPQFAGQGNNHQWSRRALIAAITNRQWPSEAAASAVPAAGYCAPLKVQFELTRRCNLRCRHCYNTSGRGLQRELTDTEWLSLASQCSTMGVFHLSLSGGEPFLRSDLVFELLDLCENTNTAVSINTNGTLLTEPIVRRLDNYGCLFKTQVSLDGARPGTHDSIRGCPGAWEVAVRTLARLNGLRGCVAIACVLMEGNHQEAGELVDLAADLGVDRISFGHLFRLGRAVECSTVDEITDEGLRCTLAQLKARQQRYGQRPQILVAYENERNWNVDIAQPNTGCVVCPDGSVIYRCYLPEALGSVRDSALADVWKCELQAVHEEGLLIEKLHGHGCASSAAFEA